MARRPRVYIEGCPVHVTMRGVEKRDIFLDDSDRLFYLAALEDSARVYGFPIHAYVLMSNHVHLLGSPRSKHSIARLFQSLSARYVHYFNRRYSRVGHLSQGRHGEFLVQTDAHFICCMRYVENNPVEARMARTPAEHPWSSHGFNARGRPDPLVTPHSLYLELSDDPAHRCRRYAAGFHADEDAKYREIFRAAGRSGFAVGSAEFLEWAAVKTGRPLPRMMRGAA